MNWIQRLSQTDLSWILSGPSEDSRVGQESGTDSFQDMFNAPSRQEVRRDPPQQESVTLTLYHGSKWKELGNDLVLDPNKSEQGALWFSLQTDDAKWRGPWLVTYPLKVIKHIERVYYDDGSTYDDIPKQIKNVCEPIENCRFYSGIELPEGWFFSYKVEKHIICTIPLKINRDMLQRIE